MGPCALGIDDPCGETLELAREHWPAAFLVEIEAGDMAGVMEGITCFAFDRISAFRLQGADFTDPGRRIAGAGLPTMLCMEGGYAIAEIGVKTANLLEGFAQE